MSVTIQLHITSKAETGNSSHIAIGVRPETELPLTEAEVIVGNLAMRLLSKLMENLDEINSSFEKAGDTHYDEPSVTEDHFKALVESMVVEIKH
jgi:hypothetical protein